MSRSVTPEDIDAILPQTQCGLCGYGGCMPYAEALVKDNAAINLCPPGGVKGLRAIASLLQVDAEPFVPEMEIAAKPTLVALIREAECIGCAKCIKACPVDAILGSAKNMHTVIGDECTGCELCVAPCPVDCIDMIEVPERQEHEQVAKATIARERYRTREARLKNEKEHPLLKTHTTLTLPQNQEEQKTYILSAIARVKQKKLER